MRYAFKFGFLGKKVQMFSERNMGVVIEKEPHVVCLYGTDENHSRVLCAVPLCHPKYLRGAEYIIEFEEKDRVKICVGEFQIVIDYSKKKCANNKAIQCYGSDEWGHDVEVAWNEV